MPTPSARANRYKRQAERVREEADGTNDQEMRSALLKIADLYDRLADRVSSEPR